MAGFNPRRAAVQSGPVDDNPCNSRQGKMYSLCWQSLHCRDSTKTKTKNKYSHSMVLASTFCFPVFTTKMDQIFFKKGEIDTLYTPL
jgi:hypothetical protein